MKCYMDYKNKHNVKKNIFKRCEKQVPAIIIFIS